MQHDTFKMILLVLQNYAIMNNAVLMRIKFLKETRDYSFAIAHLLVTQIYFKRTVNNEKMFHR